MTTPKDAILEELEKRIKKYEESDLFPKNNFNYTDILKAKLEQHKISTQAERTRILEIIDKIDFYDLREELRLLFEEDEDYVTKFRRMLKQQITQSSEDEKR